jgi:hypothetical protein
MSAPAISFRPYLNVTGVYDTGLSGVSVVDAQGNLAGQSSAAIEISGGVSGSHKWRHTVLGLDYRGAGRHYFGGKYYDGTDQSLLLGLTHQMSRRTMFSLRESAGIASRDFGLTSLQQTVPFDPASSYIPATDYFDNRTIYMSTMADLTYQRSARLSYNLGGDFFTARRRSSALYGTTGEAARGDVQYRVGRYTTVGGNYSFSRYQFSKGFGNTTIHAFSGTYAVRLTKVLELSFYGGVGRAETKYNQSITIDPVIAAILGRSTGVAVIHHVADYPNVGGRLSRTFHNGLAYVYGNRGMNPGNGLFLTSTTTNVGAGYSYSGVRYWSLSTDVTYNNSDAASNVVGNYHSVVGGFSVSRKLFRYVHFIARVDARKYGSPDFNHYNRTIYRTSIGLGFAPGEYPLRLW